MEKFIPEHNHLLVHGNLKNTMNEIECKQWLIDLVHLVDMQVVGGPISKYIKELGNEGVTGIISLATSHAAIHIWDAEIPIFFQFDLYSCTKFNDGIVLNYINNTLGLFNEKKIFINRANGFNIIK